VRADPNGKPFLSGDEAAISLSHSGTLLAIYIGPENAGVDIERIKKRDNAAEIAQMFFPPEETARCFLAGSFDLLRFYHAWTEREATLKRYGLTLAAKIPAGTHAARHWRLTVTGAEGAEYALCLSASPEILETVEIRILSDANVDPASIKSVDRERADN
jgi:phosphopantetheinyl transferase